MSPETAARLRRVRNLGAIDGMMHVVVLDIVEVAQIVSLIDAVKYYERAQDQHDALVRRLDVALNGDGAAKQASLCDLVSQFESPDAAR